MIEDGKVRAAILSTTQGDGSGAERVLEYLLHSHNPSIGAVIAPANSGVAATTRRLGIPFIEWESTENSTRGNFLARRRFRSEILRDARCDLLHAWHTRGFEWGLSLGRAVGLPVTGTLHDDPTSRRNSMGRRWLLRVGSHRLVRLAVVSRALDRVCTSSGWTASRTVIPNGLPDENCVRQPSKDSNLRVGFLGLIERWKGIETVSALVSRLSSLPLCWKLFGSPSASTQSVLDGLLGQFPAQVEYLGRQPTADIYPQIDVIIHPSLTFDPYPTVLLEAARAGIPAVASTAGGSPEIIDDGVTGFLFEPGQVLAAEKILRRLASDPLLVRAIGRRARSRYMEDFGVARMAWDYTTFWAQTMSEDLSLGPSNDHNLI